MAPPMAISVGHRAWLWRQAGRKRSIIPLLARASASGSWPTSVSTLHAAYRAAKRPSAWPRRRQDGREWPVSTPDGAPAAPADCEPQTVCGCAATVLQLARCAAHTTNAVQRAAAMQRSALFSAQKLGQFFQVNLPNLISRLASTTTLGVQLG